MREHAITKDRSDFVLADYMDLVVQTESTSTAENLNNLRKFGYLRDRTFTKAEPLGLVGHRQHLKRILPLASKVLDLPANQLYPICADGADRRSRGIPEGVLAVGYRTVLMLGAKDGDAVVARERRLRRMLTRMPGWRERP